VAAGQPFGPRAVAAAGRHRSHFKRFNDTYRHLAGDECLQRVALALRDTVRRPTDLLARFGGEELALVLGGTGESGARLVAEQVMRRVADLAVPHGDSPTSPRLTVSIGVATTTVRVGMSEATFLEAADATHYRAKAGGRNQVAT
jgi:diguanylate cyclase (GGDEF)-like protein